MNTQDEVNVMSSKAEKMKSRYMIPGRIYHLLFHDSEYLNDVMKIKKVENTFPKYYSWMDEYGIHIEMTLAGYAPEDITIRTVGNNELIISSIGITQDDSKLTIEEEILKKLEKDDEEGGNESSSTDEYISKVAAPKMSKGSINRGAARRSFDVSFFFGGDLDLSSLKANMEHGLLQIFAPSCKITETYIKINDR